MSGAGSVTGPAPDLVAALRAADRAHGLFTPGSAVVVGVSGGGDSVALLGALRDYSHERDLRLHVGHLDHMLRPTSVDDAAWVAQLAREWGVPATLEARDVRRLAADTGRGIEDAARQARYAFLAAVALRIGAATVAVGHHADDQVETIVANFVRGAGLAGLRGMTPVAAYPIGAAEIAALSDVPPATAEGRPLRLVRPWLGVPRADLAAWLAGRGVQPRADPSNADPAFLRNRLRHDILPRLEALNPALRGAVLRNAEAIGGDLAFLDAAADAAWADAAAVEPARVTIRRAAWDALAVALQRRLLRRALAHAAGGERDIGWEAVEAARQAIVDGRTASLPGSTRLSSTPDAVRVERARPLVPPLRLSTEPTPVVVPGTTRLPGGWTVAAELRPARPSDAVPPRDAWQAWLDADAVGPRLAVRARRPGDRMQPLGLGGHHKSLQDLFVDANIPQPVRDGWPILVAGDTVIWIPGLRMADAVRVRPETRRLLILRVEAPPGIG